MKKECNLIQDILPLYVEDMASEYTREFVEKHLTHCPECQKNLEDLRKDTSVFSKDNVEVTSTMPLKTLKKKLSLKKLQTILCTAALMLALVVTIFAYLTLPGYFPYTEDLLTLTENADGTVTVTFDDAVTGYNCTHIKNPDNGATEYFIEAWDTVLDSRLHWRGTQSVTIVPASEEDFHIYYAQNISGSEADVLLYGKGLNTDYGVVTLPRLALGYYLILAALLAVILALALLIFRKKRATRIWLERILLLPVSYMLGHLCIKGFSTMSYSMQRDFSLITLVGLLIYGALLCVLSLYQRRRSIPQ